MTPPVWAAFIIDWLWPSSVVCAIGLPILRVIVRCWRSVEPWVTSKNVLHDIAGGFLLPQYVVLVASIKYPPLLSHVDGHAYFLAGLMGIVYTFSEVMERGPINIKTKVPARREK